MVLVPAGACIKVLSVVFTAFAVGERVGERHNFAVQI